MTDTPPVPPTPETPATPPAAGYAPAAPGPKQTLSLVSFILGIAGIVFSWVLVLGFLASLAAVILGFVARKNEPGAPKWMSLLGIILGFVALGIGLIVTIVTIISFAALSTVPTY